MALAPVPPQQNLPTGPTSQVSVARALPTNSIVSAGTQAPVAPPAAVGGTPQTVSPQALLSLLQTLGKPLGATVGQSTTPAILNVLVSGGTGSASQGGSAFQANLAAPPGAASLGTGTPVKLSAETLSGSPRLLVTVTGSTPQLTGEARPADAARQGSLAPLMADVARLANNLKGPSSVNAALERLLGLTLSGDQGRDAGVLKANIQGQQANTDTLRQSLPSSFAQGAPNQPIQLPSGSAQPLPQALMALIRALGLNPTAGDSSGGQPNAETTPAGAKQASGDQSQAKPSTPLPQQTQLNRLPSLPVPSDQPDFSDPSILQGLKNKAEAALSRSNLLQALDMQTQARGGEATQPMRLDLPLLVGQEAAVLSVLIDQEAPGNAAEDPDSKTWRFRFAVETKAIGGVDGYIALRPSAIDQENVQLDVGVRATDQRTLSALEDSRRALIDQLANHGLTVTNLTLAILDDESRSSSDGPFNAEAQSATHFVDVSS